MYNRYILDDKFNSIYASLLFIANYRICLLQSAFKAHPHLQFAMDVPVSEQN